MNCKLRCGWPRFQVHEIITFLGEYGFVKTGPDEKSAKVSKNMQEFLAQTQMNSRTTWVLNIIRTAIGGCLTSVVLVDSDFPDWTTTNPTRHSKHNVEAETFFRDNTFIILFPCVGWTCRGGRIVQAAACRAAIYGFNSHPRLQRQFFAGFNSKYKLSLA
jgi:hypothetical protein